MNTSSPRPGDAVRITVGKPGVQAGSIAVIQGVVREFKPDDTPEICFGFRAPFRDPYHTKPECVSASGGPSWRIATCDLTPTAETLELTFWYNKDGISGPGRGVYYKQVVPVWDYTPTEKGRQVVQDWLEAGQERSAA
jgi:hypothetical protein